MIRSAPSFRLSLIVAATAALSVVHAEGTYLEAFQGLYVGNGNGAFTGVEGNGGANDASNPFRTSKSFTGLNSQGVRNTMTVSGSAYSSSSYGSIHIYGAGTVTNPYYNATNAPYYDGSGDPNPMGSPDQIAIHGNAGWGDTLTYTGLQGTGYLVNYYFRLEGTVSGDTEAGLNFSTSATNAPSYNPRTRNGNELWITPDYRVDWGVPFDINVDFFAGLTTYVSQRAEGATISGSADYSHTLTLAGIVVKDATGKPVTGWSVGSAAGASYPQVVPEPTSLAALALGVGGFVHYRRKNRP